jgi:hypothetical protein
VSLGAVFAGACAGVGASVPMSAVMLVAQRLGLMGQQPPEKITEAAASRAGNTSRRETTTHAASVVAHLGFGAAAGAVYGVARERLPRAWPGAATGVAYGLAVWAASYQGWVPALGIMPAASRDRPGRPASMATAHVVFGLALDRLLARR